MKKTNKGYQFTVHLDEETAQFIIRFAKFDCRSPENAIRMFVTKEIRKKKIGDGKDG